VVATPANASDASAAVDLVASLVNETDKPEVLGDSAYANANTREALGDTGFTVTAKCPPVRNATGRFTKDRCAVDLEAKTVTCPARQVVAIAPTRNVLGRAPFKAHCSTCPLRTSCTAARSGRTITVHPKEAILARARAEQKEPGWAERYRADRPIVERKIAHFIRRRWDGRHARTRGLRTVRTDLDTRAGAINWARLAVPGLGRDAKGWVLAAD